MIGGRMVVITGIPSSSGDAKKNGMIRRALFWGVSALVLILALYVAWPSRWLTRRSILALRSRVLSAEPAEFWSIFHLGDSVRSLSFEEGPVFVSEAVERGWLPTREAAERFLDNEVLPAFLASARRNAASYSRQAGLFWSEIDDFTIDYTEKDTENPWVSEIIGIVVVSPRRFEFDVYRGESGSYIFPLPRSAFQLVLADALRKRGLAVPAWLSSVDAALDEARFAELEPSTIKRVSAFPPGLQADVIDWRATLSALLDTPHDTATLDELEGLFEAAAKAGFVGASLLASLQREAKAIRLFNEGKYSVALELFHENLSAGFPGTPYYLSLCSLKLGERDFPGSYMRELFDDLRRTETKKGRE